MRKQFLGCILCISSCGFSSDPAFNQYKMDEMVKECPKISVTNRFRYNSNNEGSTRQTFKIETDKNASGHVYGYYHSYLNDNNFLGRIASEKNIRDEVCKDSYIKDVLYLDQE